jgi:hypothetical protein
MWKTKDTLAAKFDYDLRAMVRDMRSREKRSGHKLVSFVKERTARKTKAKVA